MKKIVLSVLVLTAVFMAACSDHIDTPNDTTSLERIVFMPIDNSQTSAPLFPLVSANIDGSNLDTISSPGVLLAVGGDKIVWTDNESRSAPDLKISDNGGSNVRRIDVALANDETLAGELYALSADGAKFAFSTYRTGDKKYRLFVINTDGSNKQEITAQFNAQSTPTFSPDGSKVAYYTSVDGGFPTTSGTIEIAQIATLQHSTLTSIDNSSVDGAGRISWSKNNAIAYYDSYKIFSIHEDGSNKHLVEGGAACAVWSPDGSSLAYCADPLYPTDPEYFGIYVTTDEGLTKTKITPDDTTKYGFPQWSADGKKLVVTSWAADFDNAKFSLIDLDVATHKMKVIATPGAFGYYVK